MDDTLSFFSGFAPSAGQALVSAAQRAQALQAQKEMAMRKEALDRMKLQEQSDLKEAIAGNRFVPSEQANQIINSLAGKPINIWSDNDRVDRDVLKEFMDFYRSKAIHKGGQSGAKPPRWNDADEMGKAKNQAMIDMQSNRNPMLTDAERAAETDRRAKTLYMKARGEYQAQYPTASLPKATWSSVEAETKPFTIGGWEPPVLGGALSTKETVQGPTVPIEPSPISGVSESKSIPTATTAPKKRSLSGY